jgi:hypothetical protein
MRTISGLYDTYEQASSAVEALEDAGISSNDISVVAAHGDQGSGNAGDADGTAEGAGVGAALGGVGGLLAGVGAFAIPGIGPVVGAGWLAAMLVGAAAGGVAGGLLGSLTDAGIDERDAHVYAEGVRRGGTLVIARVDEAQADAAQAILGKSGSIDTGLRRSEYETGGWAGFSGDDDARDPLARDEYRRKQDDDPMSTSFPR